MEILFVTMVFNHVLELGYRTLRCRCKIMKFWTFYDVLWFENWWFCLGLSLLGKIRIHMFSYVLSISITLKKRTDSRFCASGPWSETLSWSCRLNSNGWCLTLLGSRNHELEISYIVDSLWSSNEDHVFISWGNLLLYLSFHLGHFTQLSSFGVVIQLLCWMLFYPCGK